MSNNLVEEVFIDLVLKILDRKNDKLPQTSEETKENEMSNNLMGATISRERFLEEVFKQLKSEDYKERLSGEFRLLNDKIEKLGMMLHKYSKNELNFKPNCSLETLTMQYNAMVTYQNILVLRASIEDIKL